MSGEIVCSLKLEGFNWWNSAPFLLSFPDLRFKGGSRFWLLDGGFSSDEGGWVLAGALTCRMLSLSKIACCLHYWNAVTWLGTWRWISSASFDGDRDLSLIPLFCLNFVSLCGGVWCKYNGSVLNGYTHSFVNVEAVMLYSLI